MLSISQHGRVTVVNLAMKSHCSVRLVHVHQAQLRVEVSSKEIEIAHVAVDVVHLVCSRQINQH